MLFLFIYPFNAIVLSINEASTFYSLVDILLAYSYDVRTTLGERYFFLHLARKN